MGSKLMAKVLRRFQRLDIGSPKTAFMLFRVIKVMSQDNLFTCLQNCANSQGYLFQSEDGKNEHIFSGDFKSFVAELLITSILNAIGDFVNGGPSVELADTEKTEQEKVA